MGPLNLPVEKFTSIIDLSPGRTGVSISSSDNNIYCEDQYVNCYAEPPDTMGPQRRRYDTRHQITSASDTIPQLDDPTSTISRYRVSIANFVERLATPPLPSKDSVQIAEPLLVHCNLQSAAHAPLGTNRRELRVEDYMLEILQQPIRCKAARTTGRAFVAPIPIIRLEIHDGDNDRKWLRSPCFFMCANLYDPAHNVPIRLPPSETLTGGLISQLHCVIDESHRENGYFVFGDLSVKVKGQFRLRFSLFEIMDSQVKFIKSTLSEKFIAYSRKPLAAVIERTPLSTKCSGKRGRMREEVVSPALASRSTPLVNKFTTATPPARVDHLQWNPRTTDCGPSSPATIVSAFQAIKQKLARIKGTGEYLKDDHASEPQNETKASAYSSCMPVVSFPTQPTGTLKIRIQSGGPKADKCEPKQRAKVIDKDDHNNFCFNERPWREPLYLPDDKQQQSLVRTTHYPQLLPVPSSAPVPSMMYPEQDANSHYISDYMQGQALTKSSATHSTGFSTRSNAAQPATPQHSLYPATSSSSQHAAFQPQLDRLDRFDYLGAERDSVPATSYFTPQATPTHRSKLPYIQQEPQKLVIPPFSALCDVLYR
ncbi:velvet factor-domain-containing protein [Lipomyces starkeyi]